MKSSPSLPERPTIDEIANGFRASQVLLTANRLGLFRLLRNEELSLEEIVERLQTDRRGTRILCDALVGLALLERSGDRYRNAPLALRHLVPDAPEAKIAQLYHTARLYERWAGLYDSVRTGSPVSDEVLDPRLSGGRKEFAEAMADSARASVGPTAEKLDLTGVRRLLDVGGGPGLFSIEFALRNPQLSAVVFDHSETLEVTRRQIEVAGLQGRISTMAGDAFSDPLGSDFDFVFLSNVLHIYSAEENSLLLRKCADALREGGHLGVKDFFLSDDRSAPVWSLLFAVNMLVSTYGGGCHSFSEVKSWFESAGLLFREQIQVTENSFLLLAEKV